MNKLAACKQAVPNVHAALLLYRIGYWSTRAKLRRGGHTWIAKTAVEWRAECVLSERQYKTAISVLKRQGLVCVEHHLFRNQRTTFLRLSDEGRMVLDGHGDPPGTDDTVPPGTDDTDPPGTDDTVPTYTKSYNIEIQQGGCVVTDASTGKPDQKTKTKLNPYKGHSSVEDIIKASKGTPKPCPEDSLGVWWVKVLAGAGATGSSTTVAMVGQLKQAMKKAQRGREFLQWCVLHWPLVVAQAKDDDGVKTYPSVPHPGFLLKHVDAANRVYTKSQKTTSKPVLVQSIAPAAKPQAPKSKSW